MATFYETMTVRLDQADAARVDALADELRLPAGSVARLLVRAGLAAVDRDPALLFGGKLSAPEASPAPGAPGLPAGARVRGSAA